MAFTYTRAPSVTPGDKISSEHLRKLSQAFIDRMKLGPSCPWRIVFYLFCAFRQVRNPDSSFNLFPSQAEFFEFYQMLEAQDGEWPLTGPGDNEGANVASQLPVFVFGNEGAGIAAEADRLTNPNDGGVEMDAGGENAFNYWLLGKKQRGAIDPATGGAVTPAIDAAVSHRRILYQQGSPHGLAWGDYLGGPAYIGVCGSDPFPPNFEIKFTRIDESSTLTYGTCPDVGGDIAGIAYLPFVYLLYFYDGSTLLLSVFDWIEGPYTSNPELRKTQNYFLDRTLNAFAREFIGVATPAENVEENNRSAFGFQEFLTSQYLLAPQIGGEAGGEFMEAFYPRFVLPITDEAQPAGTLLSKINAGGGNAHDVAELFVCASCFVEGFGLAGSVQVEVRRDGNLLALVTLTPDENNYAGAISTFRRPRAGGQITVALSSESSFTGETRSLTCELSELLEYKPSLYDLALALRLGGVSFSGATDGDGTRSLDAKHIGEFYFQRGCLTSTAGHVALPGSDAQINNNGPFDAARRLSQCVRIVPRINFLSISLSGGKTALTFHRLARGVRTIDLFKDIGPARAQVSLVIWGRRYIVRGDTEQRVIYNGQSMAPGSFFTGLQGIPDFTGDGQVWEYEGIKANAEPVQISNRWLMGLELKAYNGSESSIWKPEAYGDLFTFVDRCMLCDQGIQETPEVKAHVGYDPTSGLVLFPEGPDSHRYIPLENSSMIPHVSYMECVEDDEECEAARIAQYKSCRVFEPWPELESVIDDGTGALTVTLASRMHHDNSAVSSFSSDESTWDIDALRAEPARTWENALREYQLWNNSGLNSSTKAGDQSGNGNCKAPSMSDLAYGAILPTFFLVRLPGQPFQDSNTTSQKSDTPLWHGELTTMELYLRAMCEGFADGRTSAGMHCSDETTDVFNFTFENLCIQAFGQRWATLMPTTATRYLKAAETRPDDPQGFGPLPNTLTDAERFNQLSAAVNLLDTFPVRIPAKVEVRTGSAQAETDVTDQLKNALGLTTPDTYALNQFSKYYDGPLTAGGSMTFSSWVDVPPEGVSVGAGASIVPDYPTPGVFTLAVTSGILQWRWVGTSDSENALPDEFAGMLTDHATVFGVISRNSFTVGKEIVAGNDTGSQCHDAGLDPFQDSNWQDGTGSSRLFTSSTIEDSSECATLTSGSISTGSPPAGIVTITDAFPEVSGDDFCSGGPGKSVGLTIQGQTTPLITVPLVDG